MRFKDNDLCTYMLDVTLPRCQPAQNWVSITKSLHFVFNLPDIPFSVKRRSGLNAMISAHTRWMYSSSNCRILEKSSSLVISRFVCNYSIFWYFIITKYNLTVPVAELQIWRNRDKTEPLFWPSCQTWIYHQTHFERWCINANINLFLIQEMKRSLT